MLDSLAINAQRNYKKSSSRSTTAKKITRRENEANASQVSCEKFFILIYFFENTSSVKNVAQPRNVASKM